MARPDVSAVLSARAREAAAAEEAERVAAAAAIAAEIASAGPRTSRIRFASTEETTGDFNFSAVF